MRAFNLQIFTPDGIAFDGTAESIVVRTSEGDVCILYGHTNYITTIDFGRVKIRTNGEEKRAACMGGLLSVSEGEVRIVATTFEYADKIDETRALAAKERAEQILVKATDSKEIHLAEVKLKRALNRLEVAGLK